MGGAASMPERRPGVPRLRHGVGVGVGHACTEGIVHGAISDDGDPFTGLFIAASCNSRSSHGQVVQYVTVTVYDYWDRIVGTRLIRFVITSFTYTLLST